MLNWCIDVDENERGSKAIEWLMALREIDDLEKKEKVYRSRKNRRLVQVFVESRLPSSWSQSYNTVRERVLLSPASNPPGKVDQRFPNFVDPSHTNVPHSWPGNLGSPRWMMAREK